MGKLTTPEERAAELRARLSGQVPNRTSRRNNRVASTLPNPMFAAALHAASRDANGAELSPMEARLVRMLKTFATDQEVAGYGKMYTETKDQAGKGTLSGTIFSGAALSMNADTAYTDNDMVADAKAMASDFLAMPENKIIDITTIDTECTDSAEYMEALTGAGSGITVLSAPEIEEEESKPIQEKKKGGGSTTSNAPNSNAITNSAINFKMTLKRFKCHRKQNDSLLGPRNEIYWGLAAGSDVRNKESFRTGQYGEIEDGSVREMGQTYFEGAVIEHFAGHIECWERDDSGDSFYNKMIQTLKDISDFAIDAAVAANSADDWGDEHGTTGKAAAILALVGICGRLVAALLEWLTNDDDLVFRREIAFTKSALLVWRTRASGELSFMFDGGHQGKHELWIKCEAIPHKSGTLAGWTCSDGQRTAGPVIIGESLDGVSLVDFNNQLCGIFRDLNGVFQETKYYRGNKKWSLPTRMEDGKIRSGWWPALATFKNRLYCLYREDGSERLCCISTGNGVTWRDPIYAGGSGARTIDGPAVCGYGDELIAVFRGTDSRINWSKSTDGVNWTDSKPHPSSVPSYRAPCIVVYKGTVYCFIHHYGRDTLCVSKYNGSVWSSFEDLGGVMESAPQASVTPAGTMIVSWASGVDQFINFIETDIHGNWTPISWWPNVLVSGPPGMANWDGKLWMYAGLASL
ncbi:hypothetical protein BGAL_0305g00010 [Botrytis galanthina]|uniref:Uncharacterized protein n=1 Tax=Botrytis galanthina TaxID=278940 RepID=A0A4S8R328_9HELO|nr:hypothetical protein BGAL_0305g00010 [Botrytis galanthina]